MMGPNPPRSGAPSDPAGGTFARGRALARVAFFFDAEPGGLILRARLSVDPADDAAGVPMQNS